MTERNPAFSTHRRKEVPDPSPGALTPAEREHLQDRIHAGAAPNFRVIRKVARLADDRCAKLDRIERVCKQAMATPEQYTVSDLSYYIQDIMRGDRL
jgi:hypothetical protein